MRTIIISLGSLGKRCVGFFVTSGARQIAASGPFIVASERGHSGRERGAGRAEPAMPRRERGLGLAGFQAAWGGR